jgi:hypothetical protein
MGKEQRYTLSFNIRDGDNQYYGDTWADFDQEPTEHEQVEFVIRQYCGGDSDAETEEIVQAAIKEYEQHGYFEETPGYRHFTDIGIAESAADRINAELLECCKLALRFSDRKNPKVRDAYNRIKEAIAEAESDV